MSSQKSEKNNSKPKFVNRLGEPFARYDLLADHLDYNFIKACTDRNKLEKILEVLTSRNQDAFPVLLKTTRERLLSLRNGIVDQPKDEESFMGALLRKDDHFFDSLKADFEKITSRIPDDGHSTADEFWKSGPIAPTKEPTRGRFRVIGMNVNKSAAGDGEDNPEPTRMSPSITNDADDVDYDAHYKSWIDEADEAEQYESLNNKIMDDINQKQSLQQLLREVRRDANAVMNSTIQS